MHHDQFVHLFAWDDLSGWPRHNLGLQRNWMAVRVRLKSSAKITKPSEHEANGGQVEESPSVAIESFEILGKTTAAIQPCNRSFDDPPYGQNDQTFGLIGSPDDFRFELRQDFGQYLVEDWVRICVISKQLL